VGLSREGLRAGCGGTRKTLNLIIFFFKEF
jgi:hypothetical protein